MGSIRRDGLFNPKIVLPQTLCYTQVTKTGRCGKRGEAAGRQQREANRKAERERHLEIRWREIVKE
jgi:hypothetical protein